MSNLSIKKGEKLSTEQGAGLTEKGRKKYNRENNANLKAPAPTLRPKRTRAGRNHSAPV